MNTLEGKAKEGMRAATWQEQIKCKQAKIGHGIVQATKKLVL
jgi:hypothetical protein